MEKRYSLIPVVGKDGKTTLTCRSTKLPVKWTVDRIETILTDILVWMRENNDDNNNIFVDEYMVKHGYYPRLLPQSIRGFEKMDPLPDLTEIYRLYSMVKKVQEMKLLKGGLTKKYDPTITKLTLSHHHGYKDHLEQGAQNTYLQQNILNANFIQGKSAAELAKYYQQVIRNLPGSQSIPLPGTEEIRADIE